VFLPIPVLLGIGAGLAIPSAFFVYEYSIERKGPYVTLTPFRKSRNPDTREVVQGREEVDFDPRHGHYMKIGEVLIALSSASLVFIPSLHSSSSLPWLGFPLILLGLTVVFALGFMGALTYFYEMFLFDPRSFTAFRSSLVFTLGFGAFGCFALAYVTLAVIAGCAIANGAILSLAH
jgi:hypothetical protein